MGMAIMSRRALSPSTPRAKARLLRASGMGRSARPSIWLPCQEWRKNSSRKDPGAVTTHGTQSLIVQGTHINVNFNFGTPARLNAN